MRPVSVEFVLKGNLDKEIDRIRLNVKSFGKDGAKSYHSLLNASNQAFSGLSAGAQRQVVALQKVIVSLKKSEEVHESLKNEFNLGKISATQFAEASARLAVQQATLKGQAADLNSSLQRELTMNKQVKGSYNERVATLKSLKETYAQLSEEEINNKEIGGKMLNRIKELQAQNEKFEESLKAVASTQATSIKGMDSRLTTLKQKYNSLSAAERNNASVGGKLARQMKTLKRDISKAETANKGFIESLKDAPGPIGSTVSGMEQMTKAALRFIATPLGIIIAVIVTAMKALTVWFHRGSAGESAFAKITGYFSQILNTLLNIAAKVGAWLYKAFTSPKAAMKDLVNFLESQVINRFKAFGQMAEALQEMFTGRWKQGLKDYANAWLQLGTGVQDVIGKTADFVRATDAAATKMSEIAKALYLQKRKNITVDLEAYKLQAKISLLNAEGMDYVGNAAKTAKAEKELKDAIKLMKIQAAMQIDAAQKTYDLTKKKRFLENNVTKIADLNIEQQKELVDLNKKIVSYKVQYAQALRTTNRNLVYIYQQEQKQKDVSQQTIIELKLKKAAYQQYYQYLTIAGKKAAQGFFPDLLKQGESYLDYLNRKIEELKSKTAPTKDETKKLVIYTVERKKLTGSGSAVDALKREIAAKKKLYGDDILAFQEYLKKKKEVLKDDTSEMGFKQKIVVDFQLEASQTNYKKKLNDLLVKYSNFTTRISAVTHAYQRDKAILEAAGTEEAKAAIKKLTASYKMAVMQLGNANDSYLKTLFSDISRMGTSALTKLQEQTRKVIDSARKETTGGQTFMIVDVESVNAQGQAVKRTISMTIEEFQKLQDKYKQLYNLTVSRNPFRALKLSFTELDKAIKDNNSDKIISAVNDISNAVASTQSYIADLKQSLDSVFGETAVGDTIDFISQLAGSVVTLGTGIAQISSGDIVGGIKNTIAGIAQLFTLFTAAERAARKAEKEWLNEVIERQLKYNAAINTQIRIQQTGSIFIKDYINQIKQAYLAMSDAQQKYDKLLDGKKLKDYLSQFTVKIGTVQVSNFFGALFGKTEDWLVNLVDQYPHLIDAQGNFNIELAKSILNIKGLGAETKHALEGVLQYQEEIKAATDAINSAIASMVGQISGNLYKALQGAWDAGTDSFQAFKKSISKGLKEIISQLIFNAIFAKSFKTLQENISASFKPGGDQSLIDDFQKFMTSSPALLAKWNKSMGELNSSLQAAGFSVSGMMADMTGTSASSIADSIASGFANGYRSASDFAKSFKDMMKAAVIESLKVKVLEKPLEEWFQKFSDTMSGGATQDKLDELKKEYDAIIAKGADYMSAMSQATGLNFGVNQQADATGIRTITEQTASKLEGNFVALRVNTAKMAESAEVIVGQMAKSQLHLLAIEKNTNQLHRLAQIENILNSLQNDGIKIK